MANQTDNANQINNANQAGNATRALIETNVPSMGAVSMGRQLLCSGSVFLWLAILSALVFQPDILAAIVLVPPWCWAVAGVGLAVLGYERALRRWTLLAIALWGVFAFVFVDETHGLWRTVARKMFPTNASEVSDESLRVVSLNCAGIVESSRELIQLEPDIVLLQESPGRDQVAELARSLFGTEGAFLHKGDTSIIAGGTFSDLTPEADSHFAHARVQLAGGHELDLISLRLAPPIFRMDFWSSRFWTDHRDRRVEHRKQVTRLLRQLRQQSAKHSVILGGDFNTTPNDLVLNDLKMLLFDTFQSAGRGLGNTGTNQYPLFRVDQIWASRDIDAVSSMTRPSRHSDHRIVVSDVRLPAVSAE